MHIRETRRIEKEIIDIFIKRAYINHQWQSYQNLQLRNLLQHITLADMKQYQSDWNFNNPDQCACGPPLW